MVQQLGTYIVGDLCNKWANSGERKWKSPVCGTCKAHLATFVLCHASLLAVCRRRSLSSTGVAPSHRLEAIEPGALKMLQPIDDRRIFAVAGIRTRQCGALV